MERLFEGYYNNRAVEIAMDELGHVHIIDKVTEADELWNDEYYDDDSYLLILHSLECEGFRRC